MEAALVSAATGALKPVLEKLGALLGDKYKRFKGVHKEIKSLTHELAAMDAFLMKMSEEEDLDVQDKVWMNEVRELSYDMEDSIDDFMQSVNDKDTKPDGFLEKIKRSLGKMKARHRIANEIEDLKKQIIDVGERNARYKTRQAYANTNNATVDPRALVIFEHASNLVGIDEPKAEIVKLLIKGDVQAPMQQPLKIVSVVGSGGMGKTTLANQVYHELKDQFMCQAFISVSRNPDIMKILRTILSQVSGQGYGNTEEGSVQQLLMNIKEYLLDKRYFIVVDDIWDVETWDAIKGAFPINISEEKENNFGKRLDDSRKKINISRKKVNKHGKEFYNSGSIVITTTRINNVARSCCSSFDGHIYKIRHLDMVHSRQLFHRRLFNSEENCPSYLKEVSEQILEKCDGLPLAIIAVSGLLANTEEEEHLWNQVKDSIGRALERNATVELMMKILSLSYYDLPAHLRTCVLYLSMYQEDSVIEKKGLIGRWIGEGFIHKEGRYTTKELGERYFNDLLNRSLIQPERTNRYGKMKSCRVHDTVLDFIISKSIEENFITLVGVPNLSIGSQGKVRRLSLQVDQQENSVLPTRLVLSHVRSLSVPSGWKEIPSLHEFRHLRVLHFEIFFQLENRHCAGIGRLLQLRYLNLRWMSELSELPEQIGNLVCLEMLDIRGTGIHELPSTIVNLGKLVDLLVEGHIKFPDRMGKMQSLEVLKRVSVFQKPPNFFVELGHLKNLRKLVLYFPVGYITGVAECKKVVFTSLDNLGTMNLRSLKIISHSIGAVGRSFLEEPPLRLRKIRAHNSAFRRVPSWVGSLVNLQHLCLQVRGVGQEDMCILGRLRALLTLDLQGIQDNSGDKRLTISGGVGFPCLRQFLYETYDGMDLVFATSSMPELRKLQITFDADQTEFLYITLSCSFGIKNLPCLDALICDINSCCAETVEAAKSALERAVNTHPNRPTLLYI